MTLRITLAFDPGLYGACAILADGRFFGFFDMPTVERGNTGQHRVDGEELSRRIRAIRTSDPGAYVSAVIEQVHAMPSAPDGQGNRRQMGAASSFNFGVNFGVLIGSLEALQIPLTQVSSVRWKRAMGLNGTKKDAARLLALKLHPSASDLLALKKHSGRADALLVGHWYCENEGWIRKVAKPRVVVPEPPAKATAAQPELFEVEPPAAPALPREPF